MKRLAVVAVVLGGCALSESAGDGPVELPPANGELDYQLGGAYEPPADVEIVSRDRLDPPDAGRYSICYVNGFQTQPDEAAFWSDRPELVLFDDGGAPRMDPEWPGELILDTSTPAKRAELVEIVGEWIDGCAAAGFDAVEIDNLDTFTRFADALDEESAVAYARALADRAHEAGLAIGQKNTAELVDRHSETTFDFAVVEQCNEYEECDVFIAGYRDQVYVIEYEPAAFAAGCAAYPELSIVLRDVELSTPDAATYVRYQC